MIFRDTKGSPLTHAEVDGNFRHLTGSQIISSSGTPSNQATLRVQGAISASGALTASALTLTGTGFTHLNLTSISASSDISASGNITASDLFLSGNADIKGNITLGGNMNSGDASSDSLPSRISKVNVNSDPFWYSEVNPICPLNFLMRSYEMTRPSPIP